MLLTVLICRKTLNTTACHSLYRWKSRPSGCLLSPHSRKGEEAYLVCLQKRFSPKETAPGDKVITEPVI